MNQTSNMLLLVITAMSSKSGYLHLITGPMFSGKTTELIRRLVQYSSMNMSVVYVNHSDDTRSEDHFSSHNPFLHSPSTKNISFMSCSNLDMSALMKYDIIGIDEVQFFNNVRENIVELVEIYDKHVIISGLSVDYKRDVFGDILSLEPISDTFTKLHAFCNLCSENETKLVPALFTWRKVLTTNIKDVGGSDKYFPVCRKCYIKLERDT